MGKLADNEPSWWHNSDGVHQMKDPRTTNVPEKYWDPEEQRYVKHLREHEEYPQPSKEDSPRVSALFSFLRNLEEQAELTKELIKELRRLGR